MKLEFDITEEEKKAFNSLHQVDDIVTFLKGELRLRVDGVVTQYNQKILSEVEITIPPTEAKDLIEGYQNVSQEIKNQINDLIGSNQP